MTNLLDKFQSKVVGGKGRIVDHTPIISSRGDFTKIQNLKVILESWNRILLTQKRSYMFDPEYGSNLHALIFEPADEDTIEEIKREVVYCLMKYDDRARILSNTIKFLPNKKGFVVDLVVSYKGEEGNLKTTIQESSINVL